MTRLIACLLVLGSAITGFAQSVTLTGKIRDVNSHAEIAYVTIFIKGTALATSSGAVGRYSLVIPDTTDDMRVVFQHVSYHPYEISLKNLRKNSTVYLQPRMIPLPTIEIRGAATAQVMIRKDLPQTVSIIASQQFEGKGYVDAGDLLRTDHSVQVNENLSGRKTLSIRGGNPDEIVVLYDGVKMNSTYDNIFDMSLVDVEDMERFEIIKGGNTALYGAEAFSGVVNIVPKLEQDYHVRFSQRFGTYNSGAWGLKFYQQTGGLHATYSLKKSASERIFASSDGQADKTDRNLINAQENHLAGLQYRFGHDQQNILSASYIRNDTNYDNNPHREYTDNLNQVVTLRFEGQIAGVHALTLSGAFHRLDETQRVLAVDKQKLRDIKEHARQLRLEKCFKMQEALDFLVAYQFENATLDFKDENSFFNSNNGLISADLSRRHHGLVGIAKLHAPTGSKILNTLDFDLSVRYDHVKDRQDNTVFRNDDHSVGEFGKNDWNQATYKFAAFLSGLKNPLQFSGYMTFGSNVKFPSLFQQVSQPDDPLNPANTPSLNPEKNTGLELSGAVTKDTPEHPLVYGLQFSETFFQNHYDNKFRVFYAPGSPIALYDNVHTARISGLESKLSLYFLKKKLALSSGYSQYFISDKAAFPYKSSQKLTLDLTINHAGYTLEIYGYREGDQIGLIRPYAGTTRRSEVTLPGYSDVDVHLSKQMEWQKVKFFANLSLRNLLDDSTILQGFALRDRRYYVTFGTQY